LAKIFHFNSWNKSTRTCVLERKYFALLQHFLSTMEDSMARDSFVIPCIILKRNEPNLSHQKTLHFNILQQQHSVWAIHELREKRGEKEKWRENFRNNKKTSLLSLWLLAAFFPSNSKRQENCNVCDVMVLVNNCFCIWKNAVNKTAEREEENLSWGKSIIFGVTLFISDIVSLS
jgi:hypothetical protein